MTVRLYLKDMIDIHAATINRKIKIEIIDSQYRSQVASTYSFSYFYDHKSPSSLPQQNGAGYLTRSDLGLLEKNSRGLGIFPSLVAARKLFIFKIINHSCVFTRLERKSVHKMFHFQAQKLVTGETA